MSRDYQATKSKYILPRAVYNNALWVIRDYPRLKQMADDCLNIGSTVSDGMPRGNQITDKVLGCVINRDKYISKIKKIESCLEIVPEEYRTGVFYNILFGQAFPLDAGRATYSRYKSKFIYEISQQFDLI